MRDREFIFLHFARPRRWVVCPVRPLTSWRRSMFLIAVKFFFIVVNSGGSGGHRSLARVCACVGACVCVVSGVRARERVHACVLVRVCVRAYKRACACMRACAVCVRRRTTATCDV